MKFFYYAIIILGISLLFNLAGVQTASGGLVQTFDLYNQTSGEFTIQNFKDSSLWDDLTALLLGVVATTVVIGFFTRSIAPESYLIAGLVVTLGSVMIADVFSIWQVLNGANVGWIKYVMGIFMGVLLFGFFITAIEWWRGSD